MSARWLIVMGCLAGACGGDDGVHHLADAPPGPAVTLSLDPSSLTLAAGGTSMVTATVGRVAGYSGPVMVSAAPVGDVTIAGGTIAADATTVTLQVTAASTAESAMVPVSVAGTADGVTVEPAALAVTIAGRVGPAVSGTAAGDQVGSAVALSADGKRAILGGPFNDATGTDAGNARVYERSGNTWVQIGAELDGEAADDRYGGAVAISNDGSRVAVGSYLNDGGGASSGTVRVFQLGAGAWTQLGADLDGPAAGAGHGWTIALSGDGARLIVGAPAVSSVNGSAYVYDYAGGAWTLVGAKISGGNELGHAVAISDDGDRIAISSPSAAGAMLPGTVQVFAWNGTAWTQLGASILGAGPSDYCGASLSLSADGDSLAIGSSASDSGGSSAGEVRVFHWSGSAWAQVGGSMMGPASAQLGTSVSLSADGARVLAGGPAGGGLAKLFALSGGTWVAAAAPDFGTGARTGTSVALSPDGHTAAIGAPYGNTNGSLSGDVRLYDVP